MGTTFGVGTVTRQGVTAFSQWAVGDEVGPTAVTLQGVGETPTTSISFVAWFALLLVATGAIWLARQRPLG